MGEDPYLTGQLAAQYIRGAQAQGISSCAKHFAANNQEIDRGTIDVEMDERTLREIYLPAFRAAVQQGGVHCVMGAYNQLRGQHCCENNYLLNTILKDEWGFTGMVITDWGGAHDSLQAALNGLDLEMGTDVPYNQYYLADPLLDLVKSGKVPVSVIDDKVRRHLRVMQAIGALDPPATTGTAATGSINTKDHQSTARRVAEEGIVLLKNDDNLLPLDARKITSIAVIGENAVHEMTHAGGSAEIKALYEITPLQGILKRAGSAVNVTFSMGYARPPEPPRPRNRTTRPSTRRATSRPAITRPPPFKVDEDMIARAVQAARQADVAIVIAGLPHTRFYDAEDSDRIDLKLPFGQDELIQKVVAANPRTIVVLVDGGAVEMPWLDRVPSVLQAWYPGMEGGNAIAEVLFGGINPSGKLPCTFPKQLADSPTEALGTYPGKNGVEHYDEGLLVGYRWFDAKNIEPLFPFGFGLSYTNFTYSNLQLTGQHGLHDHELLVQCDITNTGSRAGSEVVQVYVSQSHPTLPRPPKELKGFARVTLQPGETRQISIPLDATAFAYYDPDRSAWIAEKDDFTISVASSSRDIRLSAPWSRSDETQLTDAPQ
jgi:beta-glucosidase